MPISALPPPPSRTDPANFANRSDAFLSALPVFASQANGLQTDVNAQQAVATAQAADALASATSAQLARDAAQASANYKGLWSALTGALATPASVFHSGNFWTLKSSLANVATSQPGVGTEWEPASGQRTPLPTARPSLLLDFANSKSVDPRITFARASTATYFDALGVLRTAAAGDPRINHDPATGECRGLLVEEARTNLLTYSDQFDNAVWTKFGTTIAVNAATAPDGTLTADKLVESAASSEHYLQRSYTQDATVVCCFSVVLEAAGRSDAAITVFDGLDSSSSLAMRVNLATGAITTPAAAAGQAVLSSGGLENLGNGRWRVWLAGKPGISTAGQISCRVTLINASTVYLGDGVSGVNAWGAQLEAGAFMTSYISTVAAQVTRAAETVRLTGANFSGWYRQSEGSFVVSGDSFAAPSAGYAFVSADDGFATNRVQLRFNGVSAINSVVAAGNAVSMSVSSTAGSFPSRAKGVAAMAYKAGDGAIAANGLAPVTSAAVVVPAVTQLQIGNAATAGTGVLNGHIASLAYYPRRLSNAELQALTA